MHPMLLCALKRAGKSMTAAELADATNGLLMAEGYDRTITSKQAAAMLAQGQATRMGMRRENSKDVQLWAPIGDWDASFPMPAMEAEIERIERHSEKLNEKQRRTLFDILNDHVVETTRQGVERDNLARQHREEMDRLLAGFRRRLDAAGMGDTIE